MSQQPPDNSDSQQPDANSTQQAVASAPQNQVQGNQNRVVQGNENQSVLGDNNTVIQGNNNLMLVIKELILGQQLAPAGNPAREHNQRLLLADVKQEVTARLRQSLHNAVLINLGKESQPQQVKRPWDAEIKIGLKPAVPLPDTTTILSVFDSEEIAGKLLILGAPGSGKTTTQLELAQALVKRTQEQPDYPVPVLFNLSSWKDDRQSITDWLVAELKSKYGVSKKLGQDWVNNHQLLPLLDGLDELEPQRQELCVQAINQFLASETRPLSLVVCSRGEEYSSYSTQLQLKNAIYLQPLTNNQIRDYLNTIKYIKLWSTISSDLDLLELVKTPFLLSVTVLVSQEISIEEWQHLTSTATRLQYLLDAYIGRMLTRDINSRTYLKTKPPNARKTRMWLVWLAQQMQGESKTEFLIEEIQPSWLLTNKQRWQYIFLSRLIGGIVFVMPFYVIRIIEPTNIRVIVPTLLSILLSAIAISLIDGWFIIKYNQTISSEPGFKLNNYWHLFISVIVSELIFGLVFGLLIKFPIGLMMGLPFGIFTGLLFGLRGMRANINSDIKTYERLEWSWKDSLKWSFISLVIAIIVSILIGSIVSDHRTVLRLVITLIGMSLGTFFGGLSNANVEIERKSNPNQGIRDSLKSAILGAIIGGCIGALVGILRGEKYVYSVQTFSTLGVSMGALWYGGLDIIQHLSLRFILYCNGYIPWNYARFLKYCTERMFLQRVGGRYRFIHKLLQDHFAQIEFKRNLD
jgi:NACHT domain